jgi:response regulator of citrate/malate metabolism
MRCYLEAMQLGAVDYLEKPVAPTRLHQLMKNYFQSRTQQAKADNP